jgi:cysteine-rich repeat protein
VVDSGEGCDDGNYAPGDGCTAYCDVEACGIGVVDEGEECDDGNRVDGDGCEANCRLVCGTGSGAYRARIEPNEGNCLLAFTNLATWSGAEVGCLGPGGHLLTTSSELENLVADSMVDYFWIGFTDAGHEGRFTWSSGEAAGYAAWDSGQPDNHNGLQNCGGCRSL